MAGILDFFVGEPRAAQVAGLQEIERAWPKADVIVVDAPTGSGKSKIAECISRWVGSRRTRLSKDGSAILVPNNVLLGQYLDNTKGLDTIKRQDLYACIQNEGLSCADRKKLVGACCKPPRGGNAYSPGACPYLRDLRKARSSLRMVSTYHAYQAHELKRDVLIVDEAHNLRPWLREQSALRLWRNDYRWPRRLTSIPDIVRWLADEIPDSDRTPATDTLWGVLTGAEPRYMVDCSEQDWRGQSRECISLIPLDVAKQAGVLHAPAKLVLMSATIHRLDVEALGLNKKRVAYVQVPSPIPAAQRPVIYTPVADMRFSGREDATRRMCKWIVEEYLPRHAGERGLIHATYEFARDLQSFVVHNGPANAHARLVFHDSRNKQDVLRRFLARTQADERVLVGCGMHEGLDLHGDLARHQLVTAIPRANLSDPATAWLAENKPEEYEWATIRELVQMFGRDARGPTDYGLTVVADASFGEREMQSKLMPEYIHIETV